MTTSHVEKISQELNLKNAQVTAVADMLAEGATIPFIARYRKEATGSLDEVAITAVRDRLQQLAELDSRKEAILKSLEEHGHLTEDSQSSYISHVHDLYIVDGSPLNCGMLGASAVGVEIEEMIVEEQPEIQVRGKKYKIINDTQIKMMLKEVYAYDGYLAGDWITSIDLLRTHPRHRPR